MMKFRSAALPVALVTAAFSAAPLLAQTSLWTTFALTRNATEWNAEAVAVKGQESYVLERSDAAGHRVRVFSPISAPGGPVLVDTVEGTDMLGDSDWTFHGLTASRGGIQSIASSATQQRALLVMWHRGIAGHWVERTLQLTGVAVGDGSTLSYDGRSWAALTYTGSSSLFVDLVAIGANGKPFIYQMLPVGIGATAAPDRPMAVAHDGGVVAVRATADPLGLVYIFENLPSAGWSLNGALRELFPDAVPTTAALAVNGGRIGVGRDLGGTFEQHVGIIYEQAPSGSWDPVDLIELPGSAVTGLDRRNIHSLRITGERVWISQGMSASSHSYRAPGGLSPYAHEASIRGLGGPIAAADNRISGLTVSGSALALPSLMGGGTGPQK